MKKIGFIDYYLDEWHANNYPQMIHELSEGEMEVSFAYAHSEPPEEMGDRISNAEWSQKMGIPLCSSIEEVVEKSDLLVVLSPDNPEMHEILARLPLESGKRTYIDKTFAPSKAAAERMFAIAEKNGTPVFSSSALGFCTELDGVDASSICKIYSEGPGSLEIYAIHQIEPIVRLMGCKPQRLMFLGEKKHPSYLLEFEDGRLAQIYHRRIPGSPYRITLMNEENKATIVDLKSDYFRLFLTAMVEFFRTGIIPVPHERTVSVMAAIEAAIEGSKRPFTWIEL